MFARVLRMDTPPARAMPTGWNRQRTLGHAALTSAGHPGVNLVIPMEGGTGGTAINSAFRRRRTTVSNFARRLGLRR